MIFDHKGRLKTLNNNVNRLGLKLSKSARFFIKIIYNVNFAQNNRNFGKL